jgi:hypothetical protein
MPTIGFLHTSEVHVPTFAALRAELAPHWRELHLSDPDLLADARRDGLTPDLSARLDDRLRSLAGRGADVILCTCSTLGGRAEGQVAEVPVLRVDRPMAEAAVASGERIAVVATTASTIEPTFALLREAASAAGRSATLIEATCPDAWQRFEKGDISGYVAEAAKRARAVAPQAEVIVLAQASLVPAAALLTDLPIPVLTSPRLGVARAVATPP